MAKRRKKRDDRKKRKDKKDKKPPKMVFFPLLPFKPLMQKLLKKKGIKPEKKIKELALQFHEHIVKKRTFDFNYEYKETHSVAPAVAVIVPSILRFLKSFIKSSKEKKEKGEPLSDVEEVLLEESEKIEKEAEKIKEEKEEEEKKEAEKAEEKKPFKIPVWLIIAGVAVVFFLFMRRK